MTGPNIEHLRRTTQGMKSHDVQGAQSAWQDGAGSLLRVMGALRQLSPRTIQAFGDGATGESAKSAIEKIHDNLKTRHGQMNDAADALGSVVVAMQAAEGKAGKIPDAPGPAPTMPSPLGDEASDIDRMKSYNSSKTAHDGQVASYNSFDSDAAVKVKAVNDSYDHASAVLAQIHGDPSSGGTGTSGTPGTGVPSGSGTMTRGVTTTGGGTHHVHHGTVVTDPPGGWPTGDPNGTGGTDPVGPPHGGWLPYGDPGLPGGDPGIDPDGSGGGDGTGGGISSIATAGGGAIGAGVLGGFGLRGVLGGRGAISVPGETSANAIGSSTRSSSSSVLGRGKAGAGGAAEEGPGSGRGGAGGGTGGRRGKGDKDGAKGDGYDVDEDWTEDDGQFPGVIS